MDLRPFWVILSHWKKVILSHWKKKNAAQNEKKLILEVLVIKKKSQQEIYLGTFFIHSG